MNLGICLVGISHLIHNNRYPISRSYKTCCDNYRAEIYDPLSKKFKIKTYLTTYFSEEIQNIINVYNPENCTILKLEKSHQILTFLKSIDQIYYEDLDYLLFIRFDMFFEKNALKNLSFDLQKINILCKEKGYWESHNFVNDCFYFLPRNLLVDLKYACNDLYKNPPRPGLMDMHGIYKFLSKDKVNFLTDEHHLSSGNSIYTLKRL